MPSDTSCTFSGTNSGIKKISLGECFRRKKCSGDIMLLIVPDAHNEVFH